MTPSLAVCICTRDRPQDLSEALRSLAASEAPLAEVIVSDDGPSEATRRVVEHAGIAARYTIGPSEGLAANRNHVLSLVSSPYVLFIDDDCHLTSKFVERAMSCMTRYEGVHGRGLVVISGAERKQGAIIEPADQTFLGFQSKRYKQSVGLKSVVINSTIFPTKMAKRLRFDHRLRFGSEEVDLATRMVASGATIAYCPDAINVHVTSPHGRSSYRLDSTASRLYATLKRYAFTERRPAMALAFLLIAPLHTIAAGSKRDGIRGVAESLRAVWIAGRYTFSLIREYFP